MEQNQSVKSILLNMLLASVGLFINGFGVFLTIRANIGAAPWDVFSLGLSHTFGILYGTASITVSVCILIIDIILREPIGIAMFLDAVIVGKAVDFFNWSGLVPEPGSFIGGVLMMFIGLVIEGYTQFLYMRAALGCGPRDTLLVGVKKRTKRIPIGIVSIMILSAATLTGWLLGGPVGVGTLICAFAAGPIMQFAFESVRFDATKISHQRLPESFRIFLGKDR